jgi:mono/diheme cytochrome c family protein
MRAILLPVLGLLLFPSWAFTQRPVDYLREVKPIFAEHCISCHGPSKQRSDLRLDTAAFARKGGNSGAVIVPGKSGASKLIKALAGADDLAVMPPPERPRPTANEIAVLRAWIDQGAKGPAKEVAEKAETSKHWAFQPPERAREPAVRDVKRVRNSIDRFILARLDKEGLRFSPEADRTTLIRRVSLDLLGLPPAIEEVDQFVNDPRADAYERLVERLLQSPHYGERWGRHWLDVARYADTHGFTIDAPREIWKYRDWVIDALNRDLPFDRFVIEQMAGDLLPKANVEQKIATGFHRNTLINQEGGIDLEQFRVEAVADRVSTTGNAFLGLTLGCARCHDHKYDPISQKEYFQIFAFLNNQSEPTLSLASPDLVAKREGIRGRLVKAEEELNEKLKEFVQALPEAEKRKLPRDIEVILNLGPEQRTEAQKRELAKFFQPKDAGIKTRFGDIAALKKQEPKFPTTMVLAELPKPRDTHIHLGGDFTRKGNKVGPGVLTVMHPLKANGNPNRLDLAHWLVDRQNPLTARVTVNRIWQRYFGRGLVETENDFGTQGTPPSHPELLDWLAVEFMERGWSLKALHRTILTSATYRQSSAVRPELTAKDPHNKWLGRQARLRLDAEVIRDSALAASGLLSRKMGGPSVYPPQPDGVYAFTQVQRAWTTSAGPDRYRRGIYTFFQRSAPYPAMTVFDAPDGTASCTRRVRSNTPLQALTLLNDQAFLELARGLADRILGESGARSQESGVGGRLRFAFRVCLGREPAAAELSRLERFLSQELTEFQAAPQDAQAFLSGNAKENRSVVPTSRSAPELAAWTAVARVLLNLDEFITRE